jgi:hypothetical protein
VTHLAQAEGASTEILSSDQLFIDFLWKSFTSFIMLCNTQKSIPVAVATRQINELTEEISELKPN